MNDTIAAIATPPGRGGVGIVRVSGSLCKDICMQITAKIPTPRMAIYTPFLDKQGGHIDTGLCLFFPGPNSFTGEDVLELQGHGGPVILDMVLRRVLELGARISRPGEFSERAYRNNKMDLVQVEAVAELINATSEQAATAAARSLQGIFSKKINALVEALIRLRLYVEASLDFPEEDIDFLADSLVVESLQSLDREITSIHDDARLGALLSEGINAVIIGQPNVGKSTLLNSLTGQDTAIVTPIAGTTRDTIKAQINLDGVLLNIIDTAGLRETTDIVEQQGIKRTKQAIELADLILLVTDRSEQEQASVLQLYPELTGMVKNSAQIVTIVNKIDQRGTAPYVKKIGNASQVAISAQSGLGLDLLRKHIRELVGATHNPEGGIFLARRRHLDAISRAQNFVTTALQQLAQRTGELLAEELRGAQHALSEITGEFTSDDLLGRIFAEFCIGK